MGPAFTPAFRLALRLAVGPAFEPASRLALRSQRAVQTSHGGVTHITRGVGRLGGGGDVQRRRILMGTPGSAAGERAAG